MINKLNGHIQLSPEVIVSPNSPLDEIKQLELGEEYGPWVAHAPYKSWRFANFEVQQEYFVVVLYYEHDKLRRLDIVVDDRKFELDEGYDAWNEADEKRHLSLCQRWVTRNLGHEGEFSWGTVKTYYDDKAGSSQTSIQYK